jgi:hypothetical protein
MDILDRIDSFFKEVELTSEVKYIGEEEAIKVLEFIINDVPEDKVLLQTIVNEIKRDWKMSNKSLLEDFYKILEYYGVLGESEERKTILETKGKTIVRKFVNLNSRKKILRLL